MVAQLPHDILKQFRQVSILKPDLHLTVEAMLLGQGNDAMRCFTADGPWLLTKAESYIGCCVMDIALCLEPK